MDYFVHSLDCADKKLSIYTASGAASGDLLIDTGMFTGVHLIAAGFGTGNYTSVCPVYGAAREVVSLFNKNKEHLLTVKQADIDPELFSFDEEDIITFSLPDFISFGRPRLDVIRSKGGFTGIHTRQSMDIESGRMDAEDVVWVSGPDNTEIEKKFGVRNYRKRNSLFGKIYALAAATNPVQMANPLFNGTDSLNYIKRGNQNAYHQ